jgi:hypothetical protein
MKLYLFKIKFVLFFEKKKGFFNLEKKKYLCFLFFFLKYNFRFKLDKIKKEFNQIKLKDKILILKFSELYKK